MAQKQYGLAWEDDSLWGRLPRWSAEPSIEQIERLVRRNLELSEDVHCTVEFYAQGGLNKLFAVESPARKCLMRVILPIDPQLKTASEVATIDFVRSRTRIPVPAIFGHHASNDNDLRFEWILMEHMPGSSLEREWRALSLSQKEDLVRQLVHYQAELFRDTGRFEHIGNLFAPYENKYEIGAMVSTTFICETHGVRDVNRGPFSTSFEWLQTRLTVILQSQQHILETSKDAGDIKVAQRAQLLAQRLMVLVPKVFNFDEGESTMLFHADLHQNNILVDKNGKVTGVVDWECVSLVPVWMACQLPSLLEGRTREAEPQRDDYGPFDPEADENSEEYNEGKSDLYWENLLMYERGQLRRLFLSEMENVQPSWMAEYKQGAFKRDIEMAVNLCTSQMAMKRIKIWLDAYDEGQIHSLRECLNV